MFLITLILLLQFNSFFSVFLVLTAVIMSSIGVMFGLLILHQPFGIVMTGIGIIALAGIIVNNNIVLIDTYDHLKKTTKSRREALLLTGVQRLRPVILTKLTTVLGLLPLVFHMTDRLHRSRHHVRCAVDPMVVAAGRRHHVRRAVRLAADLAVHALRLGTPGPLLRLARPPPRTAASGGNGAGAGRIGYFTPLTIAWPATAQ